MPVLRRIALVAVVCVFIAPAGGSTGPAPQPSAGAPMPPARTPETRPSAVECEGVLFQGEVPTVTGLVDEDAQEIINLDLTSSLCDWARERQREAEGYGVDLTGFGLESRTHHLDQHLLSVELRTATMSDTQAHPAEEPLSFNYTLADGAPIELSDLFLPYDFNLANAIVAVVGPDGYHEQSDDIRLDAFLVDDRGIEFIFPPCYFDACAAGYVAVFVPYTDLAGLIDPEGAARPYL